MSRVKVSPGGTRSFSAQVRVQVSRDLLVRAVAEDALLARSNAYGRREALKALSRSVRRHGVSLPAAPAATRWYFDAIVSRLFPEL